MTIEQFEKSRQFSLQRLGHVSRRILQVAERLEARVGIEPTHKGFADLSLTAWVPRHLEQL
jgi:hypothetical protein